VPINPDVKVFAQEISMVAGVVPSPSPWRKSACLAKGASFQPWSFFDLPNLVMTNSSPWYRWPIEIDSLPIKNGGSFHGYVSHNQMVYSVYTVFVLPIRSDIGCDSLIFG
jgi:hypothetical protein